MKCKYCGKEVSEDSVYCNHCGGPLQADEKKVEPSIPSNQNQNTPDPGHNEPKTALGVIFGLFIGVIGLVIGLLMYPDGTVARRTFVKAWVITFVAELAVGFLLTIIIFIIGIATPMSLIS